MSRAKRQKSPRPRNEAGGFFCRALWGQAGDLGGGELAEAPGGDPPKGESGEGDAPKAADAKPGLLAYLPVAALGEDEAEPAPAHRHALGADEVGHRPPRGHAPPRQDVLLPFKFHSAAIVTQRPPLSVWERGGRPRGVGAGVGVGWRVVGRRRARERGG